MAALHERDEIAALDGGALDAEPRERIRRGEPPAGGLLGLALGTQVVVAALRPDCLRFQVAGVTAGFGGADAGCGHHTLYRPRGPPTGQRVARCGHSARLGDASMFVKFRYLRDSVVWR